MDGRIPKDLCHTASKVAVALLALRGVMRSRRINLDNVSIHPVVIVRPTNGEMPRQIPNLARHYPVADHISHKTVLLITHGWGDVRFPADTYLAPRDKLLATHFVGMA